MLKFKGSISLEQTTELVKIGHNIFALRYEYMSPGRLQKGSIIWYKKPDRYDVYEFDESLPVLSKEEIESSFKRLSDFFSQR